MGWRLALSLQTLRDEFNEAFPSRDRTSDGTIGDQAHSSRASRHNPNRHGVVTALDITHDPESGCDVHAIARRLARDPHPELAYIISDRQIASRPYFNWGSYGGSNPHTRHAHFAVGVGPDSQPLPPYDSRQPWGVADIQENVMRSGDSGKRVMALQARLNWWRSEDLTVDGDYGPATEAAVKRWQDRVGLPTDGMWTDTEWALLIVNAADNGHVGADGSVGAGAHDHDDTYAKSGHKHGTDYAQVAHEHEVSGRAR